MDGTEYIYARNRRFQLTPYEPEYLWLPKDQYSPGIFESVMAGDKKERQALEHRLAKLEAQLKNNAPAPQAPPAVSMPQTPAVMPVPHRPPLPERTLARPDTKLRRRVLVLPDAGDKNGKDLRFNEHVMRKVTSFLEQTGAAISVDPATINLSHDLPIPKAVELAELSGIHAVISTTITGIQEVSAAAREGVVQTLKLSVRIYDTDTKALLRQISAHARILPAKDTTDANNEQTASRAIDLGVQQIGNDIVRTLQSLDWRTRIAAVEGNRIVLNAGRSSGLEKGDILAVYAAGEQIFAKATRIPLGRIKGGYKGEIEISELFGVDAASARIRQGGAFDTTDLAYPKR
jgi:hypothetical protein